jgi:hypothetical protein
VGWWAPRTPVGEPDAVIGSHEYDGHAKSIRRKAVERHKQANDVLIMASSLGELRRELTNLRDDPRLTALKH